MGELTSALKARVPTLTEVLEEPEIPDLGDDPPQVLAVLDTPPDEPPAYLRLQPAAVVESGGGPRDGLSTDGWVDTVVASLAPQMEALVSSRLRDVLGPSIQEAVEEAVERCRKSLIEALQVQLREQLEQVNSRPGQLGAQALSGAASATRPPSGAARSAQDAADLRFP